MTPTTATPTSGKPKKESAIERVIARVLGKAGQDLETEYRQDRSEQAERLYSSLAITISTIRPSVETLLYVLEMIKLEAIDGKRRQLIGPGETTQIERRGPQPVTGPAQALPQSQAK